MSDEQSERLRDEELPEVARSRPGISRKSLLKAAIVAVPAPMLIAAIPSLAEGRTPSGQSLEVTPYCSDGDPPTISQTEGPYFKPGSPERDTLNDGPGTRLVMSGTVYGLACRPIARALLDFWQADNGGNYDNVGNRFRGHVYTDANGRYRLTTIVPGLYPGRTRHIHVKAQAPGQRILTTQTYFPGEPRNNTDTIYDPRLLMDVRTGSNGKEAYFDFILNVRQTPGPSPTTGGPPTTPPQTSQPPRTSAPPTGGTSWTPGTYYPVGTRVTYNGASYQCRIAHTALVGWEPPNTLALWQPV